jgi:hypothetical protein
MELLKTGPFSRVVGMAAMGALLGAVIAAAAAPVAAAAPGDWPQSALKSPAMGAMLRADLDKDGMLSREEVEEYDLTLGRRFIDVDWDQNGKLTLYEFEFLLGAPEGPSIGATR